MLKRFLMSSFPSFLPFLKIAHLSVFFQCITIFVCLSQCDELLLAPVVQTLDSAIHRINRYAADSVIDFCNTYPLDNYLSGGQRFPTFDQPGPGWFNKFSIAMRIDTTVHNFRDFSCHFVTFITFMYSNGQFPDNFKQ